MFSSLFLLSSLSPSLSPSLSSFVFLIPNSTNALALTLHTHNVWRREHNKEKLRGCSQWTRHSHPFSFSLSLTASLTLPLSLSFSISLSIALYCYCTRTVQKVRILPPPSLSYPSHTFSLSANSTPLTLASTLLLSPLPEVLALLDVIPVSLARQLWIAQQVRRPLSLSSLLSSPSMSLAVCLCFYLLRSFPPPLPLSFSPPARAASSDRCHVMSPGLLLHPSLSPLSSLQSRCL